MVRRIRAHAPGGLCYLIVFFSGAVGQACVDLESLWPAIPKMASDVNTLKFTEPRFRWPRASRVLLLMNRRTLRGSWGRTRSVCVGACMLVRASSSDDVQL